MTLKEVNWSRMLLVFAVSATGLFKTSQAAVFGDGLVKITTIITTMTIDHLEHHQVCVCCHDWHSKALVSCLML